MVLFAVQLIRVVLSCLPLKWPTVLAFNLAIGIDQMFNVIIIICSFFHLSFYTNDIYLARLLGHCTNINFGSGHNEIVHR
jgi:hypothetical protein